MPDPDGRISNINPINPITTPNHFSLLAVSWKNATPSKIVLSGVKELSIAAKELSIRVSAIQNKNAGKKEPSQPERITVPLFSFGIAFQAFHKNGLKTSPALKILIEATWYAEKDSRPIFISMNELPQISERRKNSIHANQLPFFEFMLQR